MEQQTNFLLKGISMLKGSRMLLRKQPIEEDSRTSAEAAIMIDLNTRRRTRIFTSLAGAGALLLSSHAPVQAAHLVGTPATYTLNADFDEGALVNVNHNSPNGDQLQLDSVATPFDFIWVAASSRGTVVKIDTKTGAILGEFRSTPSSQGNGNPSRTTVDSDGSVWVANRADVFGGFGAVVHIGLEENNQCEDRNGNGVIDTSAGLADIRAWLDPSGARGVATANDECIVHYTQVNSRGSRHVSVNANNDVWVSGVSLSNFDLIKGGRFDVPGSGTIIRSELSVGFGGYGGLIDPNGVIWSAQNLLRWDTANPLVGANGDPAGPSIGPPAAGTNWSGQFLDSYGLCIDSQGNVWNTQLSGNLIRKYAPDGTHLGAFSHGNDNAQGCVVGRNDEVWVAHSLIGPATTLGHLLNDGTYVGNVPLPGGVGPTGVAVDRNGKIWSANLQSDNVSRIDPMLGPIGGGLVPVGAVDLTVSLGAGAGPYNYSDMTGSTLIAPPNSGTWTVAHDRGVAGTEWGKITWNDEPEGATPSDSSLTVEARSSEDGVTWSAFEAVADGVDLTVPDGRYLQVRVSFQRATTGESPILSDLTISTNSPPDCSGAKPSVDTLWPPNHKFVAVDVLGVMDEDGDPITIVVNSIFQDEAVDAPGSGNTSPDGRGVGTSTAKVRAERSGNPKVPGNGRVYHIGFTATDDEGAACTGSIEVCVPHDKSSPTCVDEGPLFVSTNP